MDRQCSACSLRRILSNSHQPAGRFSFKLFINLGSELYTSSLGIAPNRKELNLCFLFWAWLLAKQASSTLEFLSLLFAGLMEHSYVLVGSVVHFACKANGKYCFLNVQLMRLMG